METSFPVRIDGLGMHDGAPSWFVARALPKGSGRWIVQGEQRSQITPDKLTCRDRCSRWNGIGPLEHVSAGFLLAGIADWSLECDAEDLPLGDGSAQAFAGISQRAIPLRRVETFAVRLERPDGGYLEASSADALQICSGWGRGERIESWCCDESSLPQCRDARTFIRCEDYCEARQAGLLSGCGREQGRLLGPAGTPATAALAAEMGIAPSSLDWSLEPARMASECAAHKVLDPVGDLGLWLGFLPRLEIKMKNVGHAQFHELGRRLLEAIRVPDGLSRRAC